MKETKKLLLIGLAFLFLDQLTKFLARTLLPSTSTFPLLEGIFHLTYAQNTGAVFGSFKGTNQLLIWLAIMAIGLILYLWNEFPNKRTTHLFLASILVGSIGNLIDRILLGFVTDFIDIRVWPIFNIADSLVTAGIIGLIITLIWDKEEQQEKTGKKKSSKTKAQKAR